MMAAAERREIVVGIDPARDWHLPSPGRRTRPTAVGSGSDSS